MTAAAQPALAAVQMHLFRPALQISDASGRPLLTPREQQLVPLIAQGYRNRDVARELNLSEHTVKKYLFRLYDKLGISTRVELTLYALHHGIPS